jgi:hypothetical protein
MAQDEVLLSALLSKMGEAVEALNGIWKKLDALESVGNSQDIVDAIEAAADKIVGARGYDLSDIHEKIESALGDVQNTIDGAANEASDKIVGPLGHHLGDLHDKLGNLGL